MGKSDDLAMIAQSLTRATNNLTDALGYIPNDLSASADDVVLYENLTRLRAECWELRDDVRRRRLLHDIETA